MPVSEKLHINLEKYIADSQCKKPLLLSCVRDVAKQMTTALMVLRRQSVIHSDIKPSNILMVKQSRKPLKFQLINFGNVSWARQASQGVTPGTVGFMSPEIMLGLPVTHSTDVWSLGCVLAYMFLGHSLFDTESEFNTFKAVHELMGQPSDEQLDKGMYTTRFYNKTDGKWVLKCEKTEEKVSSLDDLKRLRVGAYREREQCVELLKKMLQVKPEDRITLEEMMKHPFITGRYPRRISTWRPNIQRAVNFFFKLKRNKVHPFSDKQTMCAKTEPQPKTQPRELSTGSSPGSPGVSRVQPESERTKEDIPRSEPSLPRIIMAKPALQENRTYKVEVTAVGRGRGLTEDNLRGVCMIQAEGLQTPGHLQQVEFHEVTVLDLGFRDVFRIKNLRGFARLTTLHLNNNHIQKMEGLSSLTNLTCLNLSFNNISKIEGLESLKKLEQLNLSHNKVSVLENMDALENLGLFNIANNNLKDLSQVMYLRKLRNILTLNCSGNPFSEDDDYKLFVIALFPNLKHLDNRYIRSALKKEALEKFSSKIERLKAEGEKEAEFLKSHQAELQLHQDAFVESLNGSFLFKQMLKDDPHGNHLQSVPEVAEQQDSFKQKMTGLCVQLFETGLLEYERRRAEVNSFLSSHSISLAEALKKETQLLGDFSKFFNELTNGSESTPQTIKARLSDELKKVHKRLLTLEFRLTDHMEMMIKKLDVEITNMIGAFIDTAKDIFAQCQDLEDEYHGEVHGLVTACTDNVPKYLCEDVKMLLSDKGAVTEALITAHENHISTIQDREAQLITRATAWKGRLFQKLQEEELHRIKYTMEDFTTYVDHYEALLQRFRGSEEH